MIARGSGAIVNVSSLAGELPSPFNATYGATKAFVTSFTEAVHEELRGTGVKIQALLPGFTRTEFQEVAGVDAGRVPELAWMDAEQVVRASLTSLGRGELRCVPGTTNKVLAAATALAPRAVLRRFAAAAQRGSFE
jgi:short-subunit dehydrogenase